MEEYLKIEENWDYIKNVIKKGFWKNRKKFNKRNEKIVSSDYKPEIKICPKFMRKCYLEDCPEHQKPEDLKEE